MFGDHATALRGRLRLLDDDTRHDALRAIETLVPREETLDLSGLGRPLLLCLEWVTARWVWVRVTDVIWREEDPTGTIEDLMVGGEIKWDGEVPKGEPYGRIELGLAERSTFSAWELCDVLEAVETASRPAER